MRRHPSDCGHCIAIRGDRNPAKRDDVRKLLSVGAVLREQRVDRRAELGSRWKGKRAGYKSAHNRCRSLYGPAKFHDCRCGAPAEEWALIQDPSEQRYGHSDRGHIRPFSLDTDDYEPLCKTCHRRQDA